MSDFDALFAHATEAVNLVFAEPVVYAPPTGAVASDPVSVCRAIVSAEMSEEEPGSDGRRRRRIRYVTLGTDPDHADYSGVADPRDNATVTIGDVAYSVTQTIFEKHGLATLKLTRRGQVEKTRRNYREQN